MVTDSKCILSAEGTGRVSLLMVTDSKLVHTVSRKDGRVSLLMVTNNKCLSYGWLNVCMALGMNDCLRRVVFVKGTLAYHSCQ